MAFSLVIIIDIVGFIISKSNLFRAIARREPKSLHQGGCEVARMRELLGMKRIFAILVKGGTAFVHRLGVLETTGCVKPGPIPKAGKTISQHQFSCGRLFNFGKTNSKDNETSFIHPDIRAQ